MAKYDEGDTVRVKRSIKVGGSYVKANSKGKIKSIKRRGFKKEYTVYYPSANLTITHNGDSEIAPLNTNKEE